MSTAKVNGPSGVGPPATSGLAIGDLLRRPEAGAFLGLIAVLFLFVVFGSVNFLKLTGAASWLNVAANLGIIAIPMGLLMISGELDISIGAMIPAGSMAVAIVSGHYGLPISLGILASLALGVAGWPTDFLFSARRCHH